ncbi:MAG TPA: hypothetical protein IGS40_03495 [Trichormus sp. M33_DOE_039]|nr:hypothetical protein [Trichormus sp. M33_DOE_039]
MTAANFLRISPELIQIHGHLHSDIMYRVVVALHQHQETCPQRLLKWTALPVENRDKWIR